MIDHDALIDALRDLEGRAICIYEELPENVQGLHVVECDGEKWLMGYGKQGRAKRKLTGSLRREGGGQRDFRSGPFSGIE